MSDENRIGAQCWYRESDYRGTAKTEWQLGNLRAWLTDDGNAIAVVEDQVTSRCSEIYLNHLCFGDKPDD